MGQSSPRPSRLLCRKSLGPKRSEIRPQWFVRPPTMRARHQSNRVPGARVYGSPSMFHPPTQASNSPNGRSGVDAPRRSLSYGHVSMARSEEHTSELQSLAYLVCRLLLEKKKKNNKSKDTNYHDVCV